MRKTLQLFMVLFLIFAQSLHAQSEEVNTEMQQNVLQYNAKINELISKHTKNGFNIVQEQKLSLHSNIDKVIHIPLYKGDWYHFSFVGDPSAEKIRATLYMDGFGDLVQDRIIMRRDHQFWTEFSFICPETGNYELTLSQKSEISRPLSYVMVFKRGTQKVAGTE